LHGEARTAPGKGREEKKRAVGKVQNEKGKGFGFRNQKRPTEWGGAFANRNGGKSL